MPCWVRHKPVFSAPPLCRTFDRPWRVWTALSLAGEVALLVSSPSLFKQKLYKRKFEK